MPALYRTKPFLEGRRRSACKVVYSPHPQCASEAGRAWSCSDVDACRECCRIRGLFPTPCCFLQCILLMLHPKTSSTRDSLVQELGSLAYATTELLLTPLQFGIPNSRLRYYLLAKLRPLRFAYSEDSAQVWKNIPGHGEPWVDSRLESSQTPSITPLRRYLDSGDMAANESLRIPDRVLEKWGKLFDIVLPSSRRTCCFTRGKLNLL